LCSPYKKTYIGVYLNKIDHTKFVYGRIVGVDTIYFVISMISPDGKYDGILIAQIEDIIRIEQSVCYETKMTKLMCIAKYVESELIVDVTDVLRWGLTMAKQKKKIVSIELNHSGIMDVVGIINCIDDMVCEVSQVDEYGVGDGVSYFRLTDISQLCFDSCDERRLAVLFNKA